MNLVKILTVENQENKNIYQLINNFFVLLDNDNWFLQNHLNSLFNLCESKNLHWAYSLRQIYNENLNYICDDNCESLGLLHPVWYNQKKNLIDMNCYFIKREILLFGTHQLNCKARDPNKPECDEALLQHLIKYHKYSSTKLCVCNSMINFACLSKLYFGSS